jgi:hypothetical protein
VERPNAKAVLGMRLTAWLQARKEAKKGVGVGELEPMNGGVGDRGVRSISQALFLAVRLQVVVKVNVCRGVVGTLKKEQEDTRPEHVGSGGRLSLAPWHITCIVVGSSRFALPERYSVPLTIWSIANRAKITNSF